MKLTSSILTALLIVLSFSGCASTDSDPSKSSDSESITEDQVEKQANRGTRSLMDRYIEGEIPGYRD